MLQENENRASFCMFHALVILLLPFLLFAGLVLGFFGLIALQVELHTLIIVGLIFFTFALFVKHNANYAVCHMHGSFLKMEEALQNALRSNALTIMEKTKSTLNVKDFIAEYYKDIRNDHFARVAPSVFPMMGILGTFIAIAISMPDFTVEDLTSLDHEISILLSGIGTAFYASIYGIFLSLLWMYFEKRGSSKVDKNIYDLEKIYDSRVWKESELIKHRHMQSELKDQEIVQTLKETFHMDFIRELNEQYLKNFTTIVNETNSSFSELTEHMRTASIELNNTLDKMHLREESIHAVTSMKDNIEGFNDSAQHLQVSLEKFDGTVDHTFDKIDTEIGQVVEKLSTFARIISEQNQLILSNIAEFKEGKK